MFGRLLRVTGTVLVIAVAFVTPVLATSAATPASADTVVSGCTIVANPTPSNFTNCPGAALSSVNLSGVNLSYANLAGAQFGGGCSLVFSGTFPIPSVQCSNADLDGANLTGADLSGASFVSCFSFQPFSSFITLLGCGSTTFTGADLTDANLADSNMAACLGPIYGPFPALACGGTDFTGANLTNADLTGASLADCPFPDLCDGAVLKGANVTGTLFVPSNQTVDATSTAGAVVTWTGPPETSSCTPSSGSTFPVGTSTVTCTVFDVFGNSATGTFLVTVVEPTSASLSSSTNPSVVGQQVTYTATVTPTPPGGAVAFTDNGSPIAGCSAVPLSGASASCSATLNTTGAHNIVATYSGSGGFLGSTSPRVTQVVTTTPCQTLAGCNLSGLNLSNAGLTGADLQSANLKRANLSSANLSGANLSGANLNSANLIGANLGSATVSVDTNFNSVAWGHTMCPDGTQSDNDGGTCIGHL